MSTHHQKTRSIKLEKPIEVLFEGLETDKFYSKKSSEIKTDIKKTLDNEGNSNDEGFVKCLDFTQEISKALNHN